MSTIIFFYHLSTEQIITVSLYLVGGVCQSCVQSPADVQVVKRRFLSITTGPSRDVAGGGGLEAGQHTVVYGEKLCCILTCSFDNMDL